MRQCTIDLEGIGYTQDLQDMMEGRQKGALQTGPEGLFCLYGLKVQVSDSIGRDKGKQCFKVSL